MPDALRDFAAIAACCLHDIATGTLVDALASLEHALPSLRREQRYAGGALIRSLHKLSGGQVMEPGDVEEAVYLLRVASWWAAQPPTAETLMQTGRCLERSACVLDLLDRDTCMHLRELLRLVVWEVQRLALAGERSTRHVAA